MNEGRQSTLLGLPGMPSFSEEIAISRAIEMLDYTNSKLHFSGISAAKSVDLIHAAKERGLDVTCDVNFYNLLFTEDHLSDFNTNHKVNPPYRTNEDVKALIEGCKTGVIDAITSQHTPVDFEEKNTTFADATIGSIGTQWMYSSISKLFSETELVSLLSEGPNKVLDLESPQFVKGEYANYTIFGSTSEFELKSSDILSKSKNTPLIGELFNASAKATLFKDKISTHQ